MQCKDINASAQMENDSSFNFQTLSQHLLVGLATLFVAGSFLATQAVASLTNPLSLTLLRFVGAILILSPFVLKNSELCRQIINILPRGFVLGFFYAAFFFCFFKALETTTALNTSALHSLAPFLTAVMAMVIFRTKIKRISLLAYSFGVMGTVWVIFQGDLNLMKNISLNQGDFIYLIAVIFMSCFSISMKFFACEKCNPFVLVFCTLLGGSIWLGLAMLFTGSPLEWSSLPFDAYIYIGYLVIFATILTVYLFQKTTPALGPGKVMAYNYLNPGLVAMLQLFLFGEKVPAVIWPGIILCMIATVVLETEKSDSFKAKSISSVPVRT